MRKSKKAKAHIPSNRIGKNRCISFPANVGYRTAISDLEKGGMGGGNLLHLAEHFFFYVFLVIRADVVSIQPLLSFVLLFILFLLCRFDFPSPLLFPLAIHYAGPFFFFFFLSYSFFDLVHYHNWPFLF